MQFTHNKEYTTHLGWVGSSAVGVLKCSYIVKEGSDRKGLGTTTFVVVINVHSFLIKFDIKKLQ